MANEAITTKGPATGRGLATLAAGVVRTLFYAAVMLGGPGYFGHNGKPAEMATAVLAGVLLLFFLNLHRFRRFKGPGYEAELVETMKEAQVTVEQMRRLVGTMVLFSIKQLTYANRWGKIPNGQLVLEELLAVGDEFQVQRDADVRSALGTYHRLEAWDRLQHLNTHVRLKEKDVPLSDALAPLSKRPSNVFPSEQQVRDVFAQLGKTPSSETEAKLQEFVRYVREHGAKATPEIEAPEE